MDQKNPLSNLLAPLLPFIRIWVATLFTRWVSQGYFSPENATAVQNWIMDGIAFAPILLWSCWAAYKAWRNRQPEVIAAKAEQAGLTVLPPQPPAV